MVREVLLRGFHFRTVKLGAELIVEEIQKMISQLDAVRVRMPRIPPAVAISQDHVRRILLGPPLQTFLTILFPGTERARRYAHDDGVRRYVVDDDGARRHDRVAANADVRID